MTALIRSEIRQLTSLPSTWLVPAILLGLVGLITGASMADVGKPGATTPAELREPLVVPAGIMSAVAIALLAAVRVGGEYRYQTITQRFLVATRSRVLAAKAVTYLVIGAVMAMVAIGLGLAIAGPVVSEKGFSLGYDTAGAAGLFAGVAAGAALFGALGIGIAFTTRSQTAALLIVIGLFPAEKIAGLVLDGNEAYMPYGLLQSTIDQGGATSPGVGALGLAATTAAVLAVAWRLTALRDVT
jgi:hypothetical protein